MNIKEKLMNLWVLSNVAVINKRKFENFTIEQQYENDIIFKFNEFSQPFRLSIVKKFGSEPNKDKETTYLKLDYKFLDYVERKRTLSLKFNKPRYFFLSDGTFISDDNELIKEYSYLTPSEQEKLTSLANRYQPLFGSKVKPTFEKVIGHPMMSVVKSLKINFSHIEAVLTQEEFDALKKDVENKMNSGTEKILDELINLLSK